MGFRSTDATTLEWIAAFGLITLFAPALTWIAVGMGAASPNPEAAGNTAMPLILLPLISSAFIPADTMPAWFQPIAEYQPFTPAVETLRGLLLGTEIGNNGWIAVAWCVGLIASATAGRRRSSTATRISRDDRAGRLRKAAEGATWVHPHPLLAAGASCRCPPPAARVPGTTRGGRGVAGMDPTAPCRTGRVPDQVQKRPWFGHV